MVALYGGERITRQKIILDKHKQVYYTIKNGEKEVVMALKVQRGGASTGEEQATQTKKETTPEQQMVLDMVRLSDEIKDEQDKIAAAAAKHE